MKVPAQLLRKGKLYLSLIGVLLVFAICVVYIFAGVLSQPLLSRSKNVVVDLTATGGLYEGSAVTYRGVTVGKVEKIQLGDQGVEAHIRINSTKDIPASSHARVRSLSPVGEQYLDLEPTSNRGPYLRNGGHIDASSTDIPRTLGSTVVALNRLLDQVNQQQLHQILTEAATALNGTGDDLRRMIDQAQLILNAVHTYWPMTHRLLVNSGQLLDIGINNQHQIEQLATSSREFAAFLKSYNPELRRQLKKAPGEEKALTRLVDDVAAHLPGFLSTADQAIDVFATHDPHLRALLQEYSPGLGTLSDVIRNGSLQIALVAQMDARCSYGTPRHAPRDAGHSMPTYGHCSRSFAKLQRGAAHAPGPTR